MSRPDDVDSSLKICGEEKIQGEFYDFEGMMIYRRIWINKIAKPCKLDIDNVISEIRTVLHICTEKQFEDVFLVNSMDEMSEAQKEDPVIA